ncbi:MAG: (Fe-S)-binding protein [Anaerolineales bacterium]
MYLGNIHITKTLPCLAEPGKIIVIGKPNRSLDLVLPYLATLPGVLAYNPETLTLTFRRPSGFLTLYPDKVYLTQITNEQEGRQVLTDLVAAINATWEHRSELVAVTRPKRAPNHLDIWQLLPRTNCQACGEKTCLAFAVGLIQRTRSVDECPILRRDTAFAERKETLEAML